MHQLNLLFQDEDVLRAYFQSEVKKEVSLVITDNASVMLSVKNEGNTTALRLHRIFLSAGRDVLHEIADFIKNRRMKTPLVRNFINRNIHNLKQKPPRKVTLQPQGKYHNLSEIFRSLNEEYFDGRISASITWGTKGAKRAAARRTLGSYSDHNNTIRINPILDSRKVPRYFLDFIVYHEMLHAAIGIHRDRKRRLIHSREFKRREKLFKQYSRALRWEKKRW